MGLDIAQIPTWKSPILLQLCFLLSHPTFWVFFGLVGGWFSEEVGMQKIKLKENQNKETEKSNYFVNHLIFEKLRKTKFY